MPLPLEMGSVNNTIGGIKLDKPFIVSISSISGGGKTAVTKALVHNLDHAVGFYFDSYDYKKQPDNIGEWIDHGANPDAWDLSLIENDVYAAIQSGKYQYIVIDYPFGKDIKYNLGKLIDLSVLIDTPLDIALSRRIIRDFSDKTKDDILRELLVYPTIRKYFVYYRHNGSTSYFDFIIDGCLSICEIVDEIKGKMLLT